MVTRKTFWSKIRLLRKLGLKNNGRKGLVLKTFAGMALAGTAIPLPHSGDEVLDYQLIP